MSTADMNQKEFAPIRRIGEVRKEKKKKRGKDDRSTRPQEI